MKRYFWIYCVAFLALAGCAPSVWEKLGASPADLRLSTYDCQKDVRAADFPNDFVGGMNGGELFNECMTGYGYTLRGGS
jgi:hypothetical protein